MTTNYHTPVAFGAAANAATINAPLSQIDSALVSADNRMDSMVLAGGNVATLVNGALLAGQTVITVDSTTGFLEGGRVAYPLAGGEIEYNVIATVDSPTQITLLNLLGTGGVSDNALISMIAESEYQAAQAINHAGELTLTSAMRYAAQGVFNVMAYGAIGNGAADDTVAIKAALTAAGVNGGEVVLPPGSYLISDSLPITSYVTLRGTRGATGGGTARILPNAKTFPAITITGTQFYWRLADLSIDYGSASNQVTAIGVKGAADGGGGQPCEFVIERVHVAQAYRGFQFSNLSFMYSLRDCLIQANYDYGVYITGGTTVTMDNVYVQTSGGGFYVNSVAGLIMNNCASDGLTSTTLHGNLFGSCIGQVNGFFAEGGNFGGVGLSLAYFSDSRMTVQGWTSGTCTFSAAGGYSSVMRIADGNPRMIFINCVSNGDTVSAGDHYTVVSGDGFSWFIGCLWGTPVGMTAKYLSAGQVYVWDTVLSGGTFKNFGANDATPSVAGGNMFKTANAAPTTITAFDGGQEGQTIRVVITDVNTTLDFTGTVLRGNAGQDWVPAVNDWLEATYDGSAWYCAIHDSTA